jgi:large exoprotein involved in heme utilization and adhesion
MLSAGTSGTGKGGEITLNTGRLQLNNQSSISSNTIGIGNAGVVDIIADAITLSQSSINRQSLG